MAPSEKEVFHKRYMKTLMAFFAASVRSWINERPWDFDPDSELVNLLNEFIEYQVLKYDGFDSQINSSFDLIRKRLARDDTSPKLPNI